MLPVGGFEPLDLEACAAEPRLRQIDRDLVRLRISSEQDLALSHVLIVTDGNLDRLTGNPGVNGYLRRANERIVGRDIRLLGEVIGGAEHSQHDRQCKHERPAQPLHDVPSGHGGWASGCRAIDNSIKLRFCRGACRFRRNCTDASHFWFPLESMQLARINNLCRPASSLGTDRAGSTTVGCSCRFGAH